MKCCPIPQKSANELTTDETRTAKHEDGGRAAERTLACRTRARLNSGLDIGGVNDFFTPLDDATTEFGVDAAIKILTAA